jgi:hypothetical protein
MALSQSAPSELLDAMRAGGSLDVMRVAMTLVLQELIEAEAAQAIGAARYERTDERTTHRNGSRSRLLSTKAGDVQLRKVHHSTGHDPWRRGPTSCVAFRCCRRDRRARPTISPTSARQRPSVPSCTGICRLRGVCNVT